jgi:hypothetical protein
MIFNFYFYLSKCLSYLKVNSFPAFAISILDNVEGSMMPWRGNSEKRSASAPPENAGGFAEEKGAMS